MARRGWSETVHALVRCLLVTGAVLVGLPAGAQAQVVQNCYPNLD